MAEISQITLPSGTTYDIKDAWARTQIEAITGGSAVVFIGVSTTAITDGGTETPTIAGWSDTVSTGNIVFYGKKEFIWGTDSKWHELGDMDALGDLAFKDSASASYTPAGSVSTPTFTGSSASVTITATDNSSGNYQPKGTVSTPTISVGSAGSTTTIKNPTSVTVAKTVATAAPSGSVNNEITYYSVSGEVLTLNKIGYTTGASITTSNVTVKTGDASYTASQPTFTGTKVQLSGTTTASGSVSQPTFTGTAATITVD